MIGTIQLELSSIVDIEVESTMEGVFSVSYIKFLLLPPIFVLTNLETISAETFSSLGTCKTSEMLISLINSFILVKYFYSTGFLA